MTDSVPSLRAIPVPVAFDEVIPEHFDERRQQAEVLNELEALNAASLATEHRENPDAARRLVTCALDARERLHPLFVEECAIPAAMAKIVGRDMIPFTDFPLTEGTGWECTVTRTIIRGWLAWAQGEPEIALIELPHLVARQHDEEHLDACTGAVNLMTLYIWCGAVEALARGEREKSARLWKRAMAVASSFGADASLLVQWTYAASFFPVN